MVVTSDGSGASTSPLVRLEKVVMLPSGNLALAGIMEVVRIPEDIVGRDIGRNACAMLLSASRGQTVAIGIPRVVDGKEVVRVLERDVRVVDSDIVVSVTMEAESI